MDQSFELRSRILSHKLVPNFVEIPPVGSRGTTRLSRCGKTLDASAMGIQSPAYGDNNLKFTINDIF